MRRSTNLQLKLPEGDDFFNIEDFNENSEIIDRKLTEFNNKLPELAVNSEQIKEELKTQAEQLLNKQKEDVAKQMAEVKKEVAKAIQDIADQTTKLREAVYNDITGNPWSVIFSDLNGISLTKGNFNKTEQRIEC